jgi:hypothetical protein
MREVKRNMHIICPPRAEITSLTSLRHSFYSDAAQGGGRRPGFGALRAPPSARCLALLQNERDLRRRPYAQMKARPATASVIHALTKVQHVPAAGVQQPALNWRPVACPMTQGGRLRSRPLLDSVRRTRTRGTRTDTCYT